jgi:carboxypeptidase C (cathepsin A)
MLFIDNPVGAGFSYPDTLDAGPRGFCTNTKVDTDELMSTKTNRLYEGMTFY